MRIAKVFEGTTPTVALAHGSGLYRAAAIEDVLGSPLPAGTSETFDDRVFSLGLAGLDHTYAELAAGTHLEDTRLPADAIVLPPVGRDPALLELSAESQDTRPRRISGRALHGPGGSVSLPIASSRRTEHLGAGFGLGFVVGEDVRRATPRAAWDAVIGACLAIGFSLGVRDERGEWTPAETGARELGTALGPWLVTREDWPSHVLLTTTSGPRPVTIDAARVGQALAWVSWLGDVKAGDVLLVTSPPTWIPSQGCVSADARGFGCLAITVGGVPGIPADGSARIDR
jgi:hypothetical protein